MNALLVALAAIPRIASALEALSAVLGELNTRAVKDRAAERRKRKDNEIDARIAALVDVSRSGVESPRSSHLFFGDFFS